MNRISGAVLCVEIIAALSLRQSADEVTAPDLKALALAEAPAASSRRPVAFVQSLREPLSAAIRESNYARPLPLSLTLRATRLLKSSGLSANTGPQPVQHYLRPSTRETSLRPTRSVAGDSNS